MEGLIDGRDIGLDLALRVLAAVREEAARTGLLFAGCVTDRGGHPVATMRMDGAPLGALPIAIDKAYTSALWGASTGSMAEPSLPGNGDWGFANTVGGRMVVFAGGLPIFAGGAQVGALGLSGALSEEDEACGRAALAAVGLAAEA